MSSPTSSDTDQAPGISTGNFRYLIVVAGAILGLVALLSYDNNDVVMLEGGSSATPILSNWLGTAGARIARFSLLAWGFAPFLLLLLLLLCGLRRFKGGAAVRPVSWQYLLAWPLLLLGPCMILSSWPDLLAPAAAYFNIGSLPGGVLGQRLCDPSAGWLRLVLNPIGTRVVGGLLVATALALVWWHDWHGWAIALWKSSGSWGPTPADDPAGRINVPAAAPIRRAAPRPAKGGDEELPLFSNIPERPAQPAPRPPAARPAPAATGGGLYVVPDATMLNPHQDRETAADADEVEEKKRIIQHTLDSFSIDAQVGDATCGPRVTLFEVSPAPGVRVEKIAGLASNLTMSLSAESLRVLAPIPGRNTVGIEVPNSKSAIVSLRGIMETPAWANSKAAIPLLLGRNISGSVIVADLAKSPHMLIAGATGSGKSVCINTLIMSLVMRFPPEELRLMLVDPKVVELCAYQSLPHLVTPVLSDVSKVPLALNWAIMEMENRYQLLAKVGVRNLEGFNTRPAAPVPILDNDGNPVPARLPFIVIVLDELADIMMTSKKEVEEALARIAQKSRAVGIHVIIATQRPSVDVITGVIKANFPTRIAFQVTSLIDSRTILDSKGAEDLLGKGDMLFKPPTAPKVERIQSAYVADDEIERIVAFCAAQASQNFEPDVFKAPVGSGAPGVPGGESLDAGDEALIDQAIEIILRDRRATTSYVQRCLRIGYNKAATIMEVLEQRGVVGPQVGTAPREILIETAPSKPGLRGPVSTTPDPFVDDDPFSPPVEDDAGPWKDDSV